METNDFTLFLKPGSKISDSVSLNISVSVIKVTQSKILNGFVTPNNCENRPNLHNSRNQSKCKTNSISNAAQSEAITLKLWLFELRQSDFQLKH